jgi:hypothetical protein|tara:strand:+ start:232 stop:537 length:306 start_codon:yes stop_codon:yes gene_type:complete
MDKSKKTEDENLSSENLYDEYQEIKYKLCLNNLHYSIKFIKDEKCEEVGSEALKILMAKKNIDSEKTALEMICDHYLKYEVPNMSKEEVHKLALSIRKKLN